MNRSIEQRATKTPAAAASPLIEPLEQRQLYTAVTFGTPTPYLSGGSSIYAVAGGDFNHDGKQDVAVIQRAGGVNTLELFTGDGQGKLAAPVVLPTNQSYVEELTAGDFNGDGRDDLAVGGTGITVYLNNGSGLVMGPNTPVNNGVIALATVPATGNARDDIAISNFPNGISVYTLSGGQAASDEFLAVPGYGRTLTAGDLNGDQVPDLVMATEPYNGSVQPGNVHVFWGIPSAAGRAVDGFHFGPTYDGGSVPGQVAIANLNGGAKDIVVVNQGDSYYKMPANVTARLGTGSSTFGSPMTSMAGMRPKAVALADFGGGKTDYVAADLQAGLVLAKGNGDGTFDAPTALNGALFGATGVWQIHLNGDGKVDLIAADNVGNLYTVLNTTQPGASIAGNVFNDVDGDAVKDAGETGLIGRTVYIDLDNDKVLDAGEKSTTTDGNGNYVLAGLAAGTYKVRHLLTGGWSQTTPADGFGHNVTVSTNQNVGGKLFGARQIAIGASISGTVFNDADGDGVKDAGETYLAGRTVYIDLDNDKVLDGNETFAVTNQAGYYALTGLSAGTWKVRQVLPAGWSQTTPANGVGISVTLAQNQAVGGQKFGARVTPAIGASIAGTVFNDFDGDGSRDGGDVGLSGRTIWLDLDNDKVIDGNEPKTLTDASGNYKFTGLLAGTYKVRQQLPAGWKQTTPANGYGINVTLSTNQSVSGKLFGAKLI